MNHSGRLAAALIASVPLLPIASAAAVVPPAVDAALLPRPAPAGPLRPTEQRQPCYQSPADGTTTGGNPLGLESVWPLTRGQGQTIAVIDTGVARHRLLPNLLGGGDYVSHGDGTADCDGHGTIVAGIAGGAPSDGFSGVAPDAAILAIRQSSNKFAEDGGSTGVGDVDTLAMAVRTAADLGATVINISSVACVAATAAPDDRALGAALSYAVDVRNVVVVTAAGNVGAGCEQQDSLAGVAGAPDWDSVRSISSPGWYDDLVLCVGSVGSGGAASVFSLAGPWVDVAAPGENLVSLHPDGEGLIDTIGRETPISGTSYAAPVVAGIAALVRSRFPHLSAREVMRRIEDTARTPADGWNPLVGHGVVDALAAVSGGTPSSAVLPAVPVAVRPSTPTPTDPQPRRIAFGGAAVCLGATVLTALTVAAGRLRRRVPHG
ncbi:type VII secretion-associated serine protease mycosin [Mycolicibacterium fortuitum]|uniref:type VII secretion-associated serine protease mycosin n=1 Tax=Mycolicibacterium fortuitum TaxID=1766 RepID=UPI0007EB59BF|nr:type VII secretion-associated serine protease mycosin [Mycolicibacterium fortuitum]NOQ58921.1 type VII secretion-associated serine protease mycosin [Mycolicibacterium fortuitum]OBB00013.1 type VII secretion-associated serine protease mycosin [Mycolicibacterium fortuitum]OBI68649.1 type VII secretion-associated serine protease mycosin [Mycolicibacterium fortuitum]UBV20288.1 type VII secretion-associated serine protease mycosin [Mycolicibacterium fortuitum]